MHIITNLRPNFYHLHIFIAIVINTLSYLNIQYHRVCMYPIHLVILNRLSPHTFYTEQSLKIKTIAIVLCRPCDRRLSTRLGRCDRRLADIYNIIVSIGIYKNKGG